MSNHSVYKYNMFLNVLNVLLWVYEGVVDYLSQNYKQAYTFM